MDFYYDLHLHSALSPCGDEDMTPNNIVNMALIKGLHCIALTDHNTCRNVPAVMALAEEAGLLIIPGMEVETAEEVHVVCLFPTLEACESLGREVEARLPEIPNKPEIFGRQLVLDAEDEIVAEYDKLLITATAIPLEELVRMVRERGGVPIPAHIDRSSYSVVSNLGFMPPELAVRVVEFSKNCNVDDFLHQNPLALQKAYRKIQSSDAHYLGDISEAERSLPFDETPDAAAFLRELEKR